MEKKHIQIIDWSESDFEKNKIKITSIIYENYSKCKQAIQKKKYVIAIGLNPSNSTTFNDDITNLYLRDKIHNEYKNANGYILLNLISKISSNSKKISIKDIDEDDIKDINYLLNDNLSMLNKSELGIVLFFGQTGVTILNKNNKKLKELKKILISNLAIIKYTCDKTDKNFIHPGHSSNNYTFKNLQAQILDKT